MLWRGLLHTVAKGLRRLAGVVGLDLRQCARIGSRHCISVSLHCVCGGGQDLCAHTCDLSSLSNMTLSVLLWLGQICTCIPCVVHAPSVS